MNILEEFWYGNIEPAEYDISSGKEYKELLQLISRNEDKLLATMMRSQFLAHRRRSIKISHRLLTYRREVKIPLDTIRKINEGTWKG